MAQPPATRIHAARHSCLTLGARTRVWRYQGRFCPVALGLADLATEERSSSSWDPQIVIWLTLR